MPLTWVALTPPITAPYRPATHTRQRLASNNKVLHRFLEKFKKTPTDFNAVRAFAAGEGLNFQIVDGFGQRLDYLRLDDKHYLMRSFGEDAEQNTMASQPDMGVVRWGPRPAKSLSYRYPTHPEPELYPAALLEGADSPDHQWLARLFVDTEGKSRQLLVRHSTKAGLFMVARHDAVEQFLWLPGSKQIVFTATGSGRFRDGLYLWSLADDSLINLIDYAGQSASLSPSAKSSGLWLMLAGVATGGAGGDGALVYSYYWPRHDGALDPAEFFTKTQVLAFQISDKKATAPKVVPITAFAVPFDGSPLHRFLDLGERVDGAGTGGVRAQQSWLKLGADGDLEKVLLAWHQFSEKESRSPLFPYSLWYLSALYGQSFQLMAAKGSSDADVLRTFGTEIARALINDTMAPTVLKGLALYTYENLMEGERVPYDFARLEVSGPVALPELPEAAPPAQPTPTEGGPAESTSSDKP